MGVKTLRWGFGNNIGQKELASGLGSATNMKTIHGTYIKCLAIPCLALVKFKTYELLNIKNTFKTIME